MFLFLSFLFLCFSKTKYECVLIFILISILGGDCSHCDHSAEPKLTKPDDVKDVPLPEWKKKALATTGTAAASDAAPFGGSWTTEAVVAATAEASEPSGDTTAHTHDDHSHNHSHGHSHGTQ